MKKIRIKNEEVTQLLDAEVVSFPKYATQLINLANQNAQGTRPEVVGQMSDLIQQFKGRKLREWEEWYLNRHPEAIEKAKTRILQMMENLKKVITLIDADMIEAWVRDLVIVKTFVGLKFQEAILKHIATSVNKSYRLSDPEEEARGIDGYIGETPISIKPQSYESKPMLPETIGVRIIYYEKVKDGINLYFEEF
ncbi:MAG: restriction endonuclease [Deltaproteobacteria bacterium RBG_16_58_17]|nr:MAG: restriction endonuclease [Deltaproteobacteria bacterium RBG_16_58_17]OHE17503.1 MAG: restriction endonuclease [Syntrophobacterales bacterium GWC2_56_13]OHE20367.1 MAG: restriction endonuclease [Syntrophobacterales bacterium GWF2_56_9]